MMFYRLRLLMLSLKCPDCEFPLQWGVMGLAYCQGCFSYWTEEDLSNQGTSQKQEAS